MERAAIKGFAYVLCHVPELVRYGSKPSREPELQRQIRPLRRDWRHAVAYAPNQVYIGGMSPRAYIVPADKWWSEGRRPEPSKVDF